MLYALFLFISIGFNFKKFFKERAVFFDSLIKAKHASHREMILSHHFHVLILEVFFGLIVAHFITERSQSVGILALGATYLTLVAVGFYFYKFFIAYVERATKLELWVPFRSHFIKEMRVSFALVLMPILIYAIINWTFSDGVMEEWGSLWFIGIFVNILFVSVLTIACTVIIMLRLIPNREITEHEYLAIINKRRAQIGNPPLRLRWIESDLKNAFVVGLKLFQFNNQTMFIGRKLRELSLEEFDAIVCHELAHVANRHITKRMIELLKNFASVGAGSIFLLLFIIGSAFLYWGEDFDQHTSSTAFIMLVSWVSWLIFNYSLLFDGIRAQEHEADAFAVIVLGASAEALRSSLEKLMSKDDLPEYLEAKRAKAKEENFLTTFVSRHFSTHPALSERMRNLQDKIDRGLPFNYYVSSAKRIRMNLNGFFSWKILTPVFGSFLVILGMSFNSYQTGKRDIAFILKSTPEEIMKREDFVTEINSRPYIGSFSLMYYVVKKGHPQLIEYFLEKGADPAHTLTYLAQRKNVALFKKCFDKFGASLNDEEYVAVLKMSEKANFTEGYRYLVNADKFEAYLKRRPASTSNQQDK
jgi:Zn-dependent protease with chaperone function